MVHDIRSNVLWNMPKTYMHIEKSWFSYKKGWDKMLFKRHEFITFKKWFLDLQNFMNFVAMSVRILWTEMLKVIFFWCYFCMYVICISMYVYNLFCYIHVFRFKWQEWFLNAFRKKLSVCLNDLSVYEHRMFTTINVLYMLNIFCQKYY